MERLSAGSSIGAPIEDLRTYILDAQGNAVPIGVVGELYVGGAGVARGYLNRPALTAERFPMDPWCAEVGARMYRTGDLGKYLSDGSIEFLGRNDHQVKIHGFRIELGEIEARLARHLQVAEAVVIAREDSAGEKRLVAYFRGSGEAVPKAEELRNFLKESLPEYMVPAAYVPLSSLPLTANGKVDRSSLPAPDRNALTVKEYVAPTTPTDEVLSQIWAEVLALDRVGVHDNFFDLGGHSLHAMQVIARIRERLGVELPLRTLFDDAGTVRDQSGKIVELYRSQQGVQLPELLARAEGESELPLSFTQERLYFLEQLQPLGSTYNIGTALRLEGTVDIAVLERSVVELVSRHESLRTRFELRAGRAVQRIEAVGQFRPERLELPDVQGQSGAEEQWLGEQILRPFDLSRSAFRVAIVSAPGGRLILLIAMHHIISDGWSLAVLVRELSALYGAYLRGEPSPLAPLRVQYADYALWQRQWLQGEVLERQLSYWRKRLSGMSAALELPTDHPRPPIPSFRGATHAFTVPAVELQALRELARREGVTLYMVLLAGLQVVLGRWSNQQDVAVGSAIAGRTHRLTEGLIGFFVNTLVMRANLSGNPQFRELLQRVRETALDAYAHQEMPFEKLVAELQPQRDLSRQALFQVMFALQNAPVERFDLSGLTLTPVGTDWNTSKFDLTLEFFETESGLFGRAEYATDLFEAATIERLTQSYQQVLQAVSEDPTVPISQLPLLSDADRHRQLVEWNATAREYPKDRCVHELFAQQAARTPEAIALVCGEEQLRYRELDERANQIAHHLREHSVGPETIVGVCMPRSPNMVAALLGVLKAGGAYLPLGPTEPAERRRLVLADANACALIADSRLDAFTRHQLILNDDWLEEAERSNGPTPEATSTDSLAYVIYTSGSTGNPKGVMLSHASLMSYLHYACETYRVAEAEGAPVNTALTFDATITSLWAPLIVGRAITLLPSGQDEIPALAAALTSGAAYSLVKLTPSHLTALENCMGPVPQEIAARAFIIGGEALRASQLSYWWRAAPNTRLINEYGPTEATVGCVVYEVSKDLAEVGDVPIGRPIANARVYVLNEWLDPVPIGVVGELYIGGAGIARGYLGRAALTAERFIANPFGDCGDRLYRSGDRVRWRADGELEFLGRNDEQLKIRGYRIEPGEVESQLRGHPQIKDVAVMAREDETGEKRLVGYFTVKGATIPSVEELRSYLSERLPQYMVPAQLVLLEQLPLSASGKVDRRALPEPETSVNVGTQYVAPKTPTEEVLSQIWSNVLGLERMSVHDNFFDIGGHSIILLRVHRELVSRVDARILVTDLFRYPTIRQLCNYLAASPTVSEDNEGAVRIARRKTYFKRAAAPH